MNLKRTLAITLLSFAAFASSAQLPVEITGTLFKKKLVPVKLLKVSGGKPVEISSTTPSEKGKFGFIFYPEYEGLYVLGTGTVGNPGDNYKFYFKGGEKLSLNLLDSSYVLTGKLNSKENIVLTQWHDFVFPLEQKAFNFLKVRSTFVDYFPQQEEIVAKAKKFLEGKSTGNAKFDKNMEHYIVWDLVNYATNFINTPRTAHPSVEEFSPYYASLKAQDFTKNTSETYLNPWGFRTLDGLININMRQQGMKRTSNLESLKNKLVFVVNDTLKGDIVLEQAKRAKNYEEYKVLMDEFGQYVITPAQKQRNIDNLPPVSEIKTGDDAFAFSYPDKDEKIVSLASLKGKVVLVDVWATWCGPCRAEIPYLKKLEEEMKGKDVAIISLSTDAVSDKTKWLKMIKDENLGGTQLFAGGPSNQFSKYYKVNTIPRFLVFDKKGKIVSINSPRPSNPELKTLLEKELAK